MNAHEAAFVEPRLDVANGQRTKQLVIAVENIRVVRVGMDGDDVIHGEKMRAAVTLDGKMPGVPRRSAGTAKRRIGPASKFGSGAGTPGQDGDC